MTSHRAELRLCDPASGHSIGRLEAYPFWVNRVAFSPDGTVLASASVEGTVRLWDPTSGRSTATLQGHIAEVLRVAFSPDGTVLASVEGAVRLWDLASGQSTATFEGQAAEVLGWWVVARRDGAGQRGRGRHGAAVDG